MGNLLLLGLAAMNISPPAYAKLMMHLARHPHCPVSGFLLGTKEGEDDVNVHDVVPLFHTHTLGPMLEVSTQLVDQQERHIVGYYHVNERVDDRGVPIVAEKVASAIDAKYPGSILLQVINERLADPNDHALQAWGRAKNGTWSAALEVKDGADKSCARALALAARAVEEGLHLAFSDFDDHFEDTAANPFNPDASRKLSSLA